MKPFQAFVRDHVAPTLRGAGYAGRGSTYRYVRDGGHQAVFFLHQFRLGQKELEFHVDESILVRLWLDFIASDPEVEDAWVTAWDRGDSAAGVVRRRLRDPARDAMSLDDHWQLDRDDTEGVERFTAALAKDAAAMIALTDQAEFEAQLRDGTLQRPGNMLPSAPAVLVTLLVGQGRYDEARVTLASTVDWFAHDELAAWVDARDEARRAKP